MARFVLWQCILFVILAAVSKCDETGPRVAIVGGGIGGTAAAHFLKKQFSMLNMTLFEPGHVGGRLRTIHLAGKEYEVGGTVIHPANHIMTTLVEELNLRKRSSGPPSRFTMVSEEGVIFQETSWSILAPLQLVYRYGIMVLLKLYFYISTMLENFDLIYPYLDEGNYVTSVSEMLAQMSPRSRKSHVVNNDSTLNLTDVSLEQALLEQGMSQQLIDELVMAAVRTNYGQTPENLHAFVGSVALAGAQGGLWAIHGGNYRLAEELLKASDASLEKQRVSSIQLMSNGQYSLDNAAANDDMYDIVVIAAPQSSSPDDKLDIVGLPTKPTFARGTYHRTVANMVHGKVDAAYIGLEPDELTDTNFIVDPTKKVNSFALQTPVDYKAGDELPSVWKVFSQAPLTEEELDQIFASRTETHIVDWLAYPHYSPQQKDSLGNFELHKHLYYINSIEWAASAMEMSVLGAKNVANMAYNRWTDGHISDIPTERQEL